MRRAALMSMLLASALLAGCTHNVHRATAEAAFYQAQAEAVSNRQPIVELVARPGEAIVIQGVERFAVFAPADQQAVAQYQGGPTPAETLRGIVRDAGPLFLGYTAFRSMERIAGWAVSNAGGNTTVGGNLGDTSIDASRTRIDDRSLSAGGDLRIGDETHVGRIGDETNIGRIGDDLRNACIGDHCRTGSPGPIDDSSNSNNPITNPPPADPPGGG